MPDSGAAPGTKRYAVLGFPARHSLSPRMHQAAFRALGMDATYEAFEVSPDRLESELARLHREGFSGLNLTLPLKERAARLAMSLTPEAERAGAVNTLRREAAGWIGHATDGLGFGAWVSEAGVRAEGARVLLLGAGGAARSVAPDLAALAPRSVDVVSRDRGHAGDVAARLRAFAGGRTEARAAALEDAPRPGGWSLLVRLLSISEIDPRESRWWDGLAPEAVVLEGNYTERAAGARARAAAGGHRFEDGLGLLLHQGAHSFTFWTGRDAPIEVMREALHGTE